MHAKEEATAVFLATANDLQKFMWYKLSVCLKYTLVEIYFIPLRRDLCLTVSNCQKLGYLRWGHCFCYARQLKI